jgi:rhamnogalacturonan hydrolase
MVVRGGNEGGLDGFDVWGNNIWVHDVEVTNKDECVTVKVCLSIKVKKPNS